MCNKQTREEAFTFIIDSLIGQEDLILPNDNRSYLKRDTFIAALSQTDVPIVSHLGYKSKGKLTERLQASLSPDTYCYKPKNQQWDIFLLDFFGLKYCGNCGFCYNKSAFNRLDSSATKRGTYCRDCANILQKDVKKECHTRNWTRLIELMIKDGKLSSYSCPVCGYIGEQSSFDIHHIDANLEKPKWGIGRAPSAYLLDCSLETLDYRYSIEKDNLTILCRNCHQDVHRSTKKDSMKGLKEALKELHISYICNIEGCDIHTGLHLHHNNSNEKEYSFTNFQNRTKQKILKDGFLELEMKKDVVILCGNHHREIHNPNKLIEKYK